MLDVNRLRDEFDIDAKAGLARCMNNAAFFARMLSLALKNVAFDKLETSLAAGDYETSFEYCHALKGVVGNLAIDKIYNPISEMTEQLRRKEDRDYVAMYKPIKELRDRLVAEL